MIKSFLFDNSTTESSPTNKAEEGFWRSDCEEIGNKGELICCGSLFLTELHNPAWKSSLEYFELYPRYLICSKSKTTDTDKRYVELESVFVDHVIDKMFDLDKIRLTRRGFRIELTSREKVVGKVWLISLRKFCISTDIHDRFKVVRTLQSCPVSKTFLGTSSEDNRIWTIKAYKKSALEPSRVGKRNLINELRVLRKLKPANICKLHETHETQNTVYLVMEHFPGGSLRDRLQRARTDDQSLDVRGCMRSLLENLARLQSLAIAHRDIKPENIQLSTTASNPMLIITDFASACCFDGTSDPCAMINSGGTPGYAAPELLRDDEEQLPESWDVFSVGAIFYEIAYGNHPFARATDNEELIKLNKLGKIEYPQSGNTIICEHSLDLMTKLLDQDAFNRISVEDALKHDFFQCSCEIKTWRAPIKIPKAEERAFSRRTSLEVFRRKEPSKTEAQINLAPKRVNLLEQIRTPRSALTSPLTQSVRTPVSSMTESFQHQLAGLTLRLKVDEFSRRNIDLSKSECGKAETYRRPRTNLIAQIRGGTNLQGYRQQNSRS